NVTVSAERRQLPQEYGVISYRFEWVGFAAVEGDRIQAGSAIAGLFLDPETTLLISWPTGYEVVEVSPAPDDRRDTAVSWTGRLDFAAGEPLLVVAPATGSGSDGTQTPASAGGPDDGLDGGSNTVLVSIGIVVVIGILAGIWWLVRGRENGSGSDPATETTDESESSPPDELLSNEERVLALLEDRGGRLKQQEVATALEWTDAKTSQVVGDLRESGAIESFRLGRENVLSLPDTAGPTRDEDGDDR
ncbi:MAG: hypothetical protein R3324_14875, partial [Halobacteriales archaeon]|nr:hypothetical protein [Halobacteriales archaeon]